MLHCNAVSLRNLEGREEFAMAEIDKIEGKAQTIKNVDKIHINLAGIKD
jgi:hypothetical protein